MALEELLFWIMRRKFRQRGWNVAITASKGDIILRIDAHTMIPHDFVSKNVQCILSGENVTGGRRPNVVEEETLGNIHCCWQNLLCLEVVLHLIVKEITKRM